MVELKVKFSDFSEDDWKGVFGAYVKVNNSHWAGPPFEMIKRILEEKSEYEFGFQAMGTWGSKFRLEKRDETLRATFIKNPELSGRMKEKLDEMEIMFEKELSRL